MLVQKESSGGSLSRKFFAFLLFFVLILNAFGPILVSATNYPQTIENTVDLNMYLTIVTSEHIETIFLNLVILVNGIVVVDTGGPSEPPPETYTLTVQSPLGLGTTVPATGSHVYDEDEQVPVTAYPAPTWTFSKWILDGSDVYGNPTIVTMSTNHTIKAVFLSPTPPVPSNATYVSVYIDSDSNLYFGRGDGFEYPFTGYDDIAFFLHSNERVLVLDSNSLMHLTILGFDTVGETYDIYYANSEDYGETWSTLVSVATSALDTMYPSLAIDQNNTLHLGYSKHDGSYRDIVYQTCVEEVWSGESIIVNGSGENPITYDHLSLSVYNSTLTDVIVDCVYNGYDSGTGNSTLYYIYNDGSWSEPEVASEVLYGATYPTFFSISSQRDHNGVLHVAFAQNYAYWSYSLAYYMNRTSGVWSTPINIGVLPGGGSATYEDLTEFTEVDDSIIDSYIETYQSSTVNINGVHPAETGRRSAVGQSFTAAYDCVATSVKFYLSKYGSPSGVLKAVITAVTGEAAIPTGDPLGTSDGVSIASLIGSLELVEFTFSTPVELTAGTYGIYVYAESGTLDTTDNYVIVGIDDTTLGHGGNNFEYYSYYAWAGYLARETIFYLYGEVSELDVTSDRVTFTHSTSASYLYKDYGVGYFDGDMSINFDARVTSIDGVYQNVKLCYFSNEVGSVDSIVGNEGDITHVYLYKNFGDPYVSLITYGMLEAVYTGNSATCPDALSYSTTYYFTVSRSGITVYLYVYTDSERTSLYTSCYIDLYEDVDYRYLGLTNGGTGGVSGYLEYLDVIDESIPDHQETCPQLVIKDNIPRIVFASAIGSTYTVKYVDGFNATEVIAAGDYEFEVSITIEFTNGTLCSLASHYNVTTDLYQIDFSDTSSPWNEFTLERSARGTPSLLYNFFGYEITPPEEEEPGESGGSIGNMEGCGNWVFAEEKTYFFRGNWTCTVNATGFTALRFDDGYQTITVTFDYSKISLGVLEYLQVTASKEQDKNVFPIELDYDQSTLTITNSTIVVVWGIKFTKYVIDCYNTTLWTYYGEAEDGMTGGTWTNTGETFNIYNLGGKVSYSFTGAAGHIPGGDALELYAGSGGTGLTIFSDDFADDGLVGWNVTAIPPDFVERQNVWGQTHSSPGSMRLDDETSDQNGVSATHWMGPVASNFSFSSWVWLDNTLDQQFFIGANTAEDIYHGFGLFFENGGEIWVCNGSDFAWRNTNMTWSPETWYRVEFVVYPEYHVFGLKINGYEIFGPALAYDPAWDIAEIGFYTFYTYHGEANVDDVSVAYITLPILGESGTATATVIFRKLQDFHAQFSVGLDGGDAYLGDQAVGGYNIVLAMDYCLKGSDTWYTWYANITQIGGDASGTDQWIHLKVEWYRNDDLVPRKITDFYAFWEGYGGANDNYRLWVDLWFNKMNASTTHGGRLNAYYFGMHDSSDPWWRWWSGNNWGAMGEEKDQSMFFGDTTLTNGTVISSTLINIMRIRETVHINSAKNFTLSVRNFNVMDFRVAPPQNPMSGIDTPIFNAPRIPQMASTGFLAALANAFAAIGNAIIAGLASTLGWIGSGLTGILGNLWEALLPWAQSIYTLILAWLLTLPYIGPALSWLGQSSLWLLGIIGYVFNTITMFWDLFMAFITGFFTFFITGYTVITLIFVDYGAFVPLIVMMFMVELVREGTEDGNWAPMLDVLRILWGITYFILDWGMRMVEFFADRLLGGLPV